MRCCSRFTTDCEVARLPAVCSTISRSPGTLKTNNLVNVEIWSMPALVRESLMKTSPSSRCMATQ
ncbi:hypothetical protein D3C77_642660 [compost metagenome]